MANFLLLYSGGSMPATEAEHAAVLQAWGDWYNSLGSAVVDGGNPFTPMAKSNASDGTVSAGPVGTMATGYTIISADSARRGGRAGQRLLRSPGWWPDNGLRNLQCDVAIWERNASTKTALPSGLFLFESGNACARRSVGQRLSQVRTLERVALQSLQPLHTRNLATVVVRVG